MAISRITHIMGFSEIDKSGGPIFEKKINPSELASLCSLLSMLSNPCCCQPILAAGLAPECAMALLAYKTSSFLVSSLKPPFVLFCVYPHLLLLLAVTNEPLWAKACDIQGPLGAAEKTIGLSIEESQGADHLSGDLVDPINTVNLSGPPSLCGFWVCAHAFPRTVGRDTKLVFITALTHNPINSVKK